MKLRDLVTPIITLGFFYDNVRKFIAGDQRGTHLFIKSNLSKYGAQNVLDVGCGTGEFAVDIEGVNYLGIDLNTNYIKNAEQKYKNKQNLKFINANVTSVDFYKDKIFDASMFISMMHHLSDSELEQILPVINKITTKVILIADIIPDPPGFLPKLMVALDQGDYIRKSALKKEILQKYFIIESSSIVKTGLAYQNCFVCIPKK